MKGHQRLDIIDKRGRVVERFHFRLIDASTRLVDVFTGVVLGDQGIDVLMEFNNAIVLNILRVR